MVAFHVSVNALRFHVTLYFLSKKRLTCMCVYSTALTFTWRMSAVI